LTTPIEDTKKLLVSIYRNIYIYHIYWKTCMHTFWKIET